MNVIMVSPHYPPNFRNFCVALKHAGANGLGLADEKYENLGADLQIKADEIATMQYKSKMKEKFLAAGVPVAKWKIVHQPSDAYEFITGYPVVAKPDKGVGASETYKIHNEEELERFFEGKLSVTYIIEEFVQGRIQTFDGLTDREGDIVFCTSHVYNEGVMEVVNYDLDLYYYSLRELPEKLIKYGTKLIDIFGIKERFFHFEFFKIDEHHYVGLEVNMRPPGGWTMDMFNYAADIDLYREWANLIVHNEFRAQDYQRKYHSCYIGRKAHKSYLHSHDDIMRKYGDFVVHHEEMKGVFADVIGRYGYIVRAKDLNQIFDIIKFAHQK